MIKIYRSSIKGFTLVEMLLVLAIMASIIMLIANYSTQRMNQYRRDRAALQMQQILNAGLSYYINNGVWPVGGPDVSTSQLVPSYLPSTIYSPYGTASAYTISTATGAATASTFSVSLQLVNQSDANIIAGELPMASVTGAGPYTVTAQVLIPGQNLNNARSINFAAVYHTGACVPVPVCPSGMTPEIIVVPAGIGGVNDAPTNNTGSSPAACNGSYLYNPTTGAVESGSGGAVPCTQISAYPITDFAAYTTGLSPTTAGSGATPEPPNCSTPTISPGNACYADVSNSGWSSTFSPANSTGQYWRVCLHVQTSKGTVVVGGSTPASPGSGDDQNIYWAQAEGYIFAMTRCTPTGGEPTGSSLNVWSN